jgi:UDP:flavonoid glycosyltransferase YjiC (YdhE family)
MLAVARSLARKGHEVVFASGAAHEADAPLAGASYVRLPSAGGSPLDALRPYDDAASQAEALGPMLEELAPDVALVDVITLGAALGAERLGIPYATLVVHPLHTPSRALPPFGFGKAPGRGPWGRFRDAWMRSENRKDLTRARDDLNRGRWRLGLEPVERLDGSSSDRLVIVATLPALEVPRNDWPPHAHVVGPCLWDFPGDGFAPPAGDAPLVLVAPSTAYGGDGLLHSALIAAERLGVRVVVTAGAAAPPERLPSGVVRVTGTPHRAILPYAAAIVCNGGHGTVVRALEAGVPLVVVPGHGDQQENAWRVERAGAGLQVRRPSPARVGRALARVLGRPSYREAARRIAREAASLDGPLRAAELVEELARADNAGKDGGRAGARPPPERRLG